VLLVADLSDTSCDNTLVDLHVTDHELGAPREAAGRVFVPDFTAGRVLVVDVAARRVLANVAVLPERTEFELVPQGSFVFYNDPATEHAGVVRLDGSTKEIRKYNPDDPGDGVFRGPGTGDGKGATPPQSSPPNPPPTTPPADHPQAGGEVRIALSAKQVEVSQPVMMRVVAPGGAVVASAQWTFGDEANATGVRVQHSWSKPGVYTVRAQTLLTDNRRASPTATVTVVDKPDDQETTPPVARLAVTPDTGSAPLTVTADASRSTAGSSPITTYTFDFGAGPAASGTQPTATHTYTTAGTYTVTVTVTDRDGRTATATATTTSGVETGPTAALTVTPESGDAPLSVRVDASGSRPGSSPIASYAFSLDGTRPQPGPASFDHTYDQPGTYTVIVQVTDESGLMAMATATVTVNAAAGPTARLTASPTSGTAEAPVDVSFDASGSTAGSSPIATYTFNVNGQPAQGPNANATMNTIGFGGPGTFPVQVIVTDQAGRQDSVTINYEVLDPRPATPVLLSPADGAVLTTYPRTATLTWQAVSRAARYTVEIQCLHCAVVGQWNTVDSATVTSTSYTSTAFPGDNDFRWRVTAVKADGTAGAPSNWRQLTFRTG
jgi:PKD repeat protein